MSMTKLALMDVTGNLTVYFTRFLPHQAGGSYFVQNTAHGSQLELVGKLSLLTFSIVAQRICLGLIAQFYVSRIAIVNI